MHERKPRIGILGIMQDLYDDMIPGIARRQEGYAAELAASLAEVGEFVPGQVVKHREDAERVMREFESSDLDGVLVVMLTYGPAMRVARLLAQSRLPICLANIQPEPAVTPAWDMADMTYNQGVHGAQDTANAMVRAGRAFCALTDDWRSKAFHADVGRWARAAAAVTAWRSLKVALVGYAMNDDEKSVKPIAFAGVEQDYIDKFKITWGDSERGLGPTGTAIRTGKIARG